MFRIRFESSAFDIRDFTGACTAASLIWALQVGMVCTSQTLGRWDTRNLLEMGGVYMISAGIQVGLIDGT